MRSRVAGETMRSPSARSIWLQHISRGVLLHLAIELFVAGKGRSSLDARLTIREAALLFQHRNHLALGLACGDHLSEAHRFEFIVPARFPHEGFCEEIDGVVVSHTPIPAAPAGLMRLPEDGVRGFAQVDDMVLGRERIEVLSIHRVRQAEEKLIPLRLRHRVETRDDAGVAGEDGGVVHDRAVNAGVRGGIVDATLFAALANPPFAGGGVAASALGLERGLQVDEEGLVVEPVGADRIGASDKTRARKSAISRLTACVDCVSNLEQLPRVR